MLFRLLLLFALVPILEIWLLVKVGSAIGAGPTVLAVLATAVAGAWLARREGASTLRRIQESLARGIPPAGELVDAVLIFVAGLLLLTPGFATDGMGLALLFPPVRVLVRRRLTAWLARGLAAGRVTVSRGGPPPGPGRPFGSPGEREINPGDRPPSEDKRGR